MRFGWWETKPKQKKEVNYCQILIKILLTIVAKTKISQVNNPSIEWSNIHIINLTQLSQTAFSNKLSLLCINQYNK